MSAAAKLDNSELAAMNLTNQSKASPDARGEQPLCNVAQSLAMRRRGSWGARVGAHLGGVTANSRWADSSANLHIFSVGWRPRLGIIMTAIISRMAEPKREDGCAFPTTPITPGESTSPGAVAFPRQGPT